MKEYQKRVIEERKCLETKIDKLATFLNNSVELRKIEYARLHRQLIYMGLYFDVLTERVEDYEQ